MACTIGPPRVEHGYVSYNTLDEIAAAPPDSFQDGTIVTYECFKFYGLVDSATQTCNGGDWVGTLPKCEYTRTTEIVFWTCIALLILLLLILLLLLIFLCCYFCRCCKRCCRKGKDGENDLERAGTRNRRQSYESQQTANSRKTPERTHYTRHNETHDDSDSVCCAGCCAPSSTRRRPLSRQSRVSPENVPSENKGCCAGCCGSGQRSRSTSPRRTNEHSRVKDDDESCCAGCCNSGTKQTHRRERSVSPSTHSEQRVRDHDDDGKSGCCVGCCSPSPRNRADSPRSTDRDRSPLTQRRDPPTHSTIQEDNESVDSGCCSCCRSKKQPRTTYYEERYAEDRYSVSQGENYASNIRSAAQSSVYSSDLNKTKDTAKRVNDDDRAFNEEMERMERENEEKRRIEQERRENELKRQREIAENEQRQKEIQRQQQRELALMQEEEDRRRMDDRERERQRELENEQRRLRNEELRRQKEERKKEEQKRLTEEKERRRREMLRQKEEEEREREHARQKNLLMSEQRQTFDDDEIENPYTARTAPKPRQRPMIRARYLDVFNKKDPAIYGKPRVVKEKSFWKPFTHSVRYVNQSTR